MKLKKMPHRKQKHVSFMNTKHYPKHLYAYNQVSKPSCNIEVLDTSRKTDLTYTYVSYVYGDLFFKPLLLFSRLPLCEAKKC